MEKPAFKLISNEELEKRLANPPSQRRMTEEDLISRVAKTEFIKLGETGTLCHMTLDNNYTVNGFSACVDPQNYNKEIGEKLAYVDAVKKLWPLFGFLLAEQWFVERTLRERGEA